MEKDINVIVNVKPGEAALLIRHVCLYYVGQQFARWSTK
jgi:hypothetical protein